MLSYYSYGATDGPEIKVSVEGNIVELPLFLNSLVTNPVSIKSHILQIQENALMVNTGV